MQRKENRASHDQRHTLDHKTDGQPAKARYHHYQKPNFFPAADQINPGQTANSRQPVDSEILHIYLNLERRAIFL